MARVGKAIGIGAAAAAAAGAAAAGVAADRAAADRRILDAVDPDVDFTHTPDVELVAVATDGVKLHAEIDTPDGWAPGQLTVVLSHGFCLAIPSWIFQRRALLEAGYRVVVWDQRSHGRSDRSEIENCTIEQLGHDLRVVIDTACPEGPLVLVGHSMGGMTTMSLVRHHAELVRERVLAVAFVATSANGEGLTDLGFGPLVGRAIGQAGPRLLSRLAPHQRWLAPVRRAGKTIEDSIVDKFSFDSPVSEKLVRFTSDLILATPFEVMAAFIPAIQGLDEYESLTALVDKEVLVVNGEGDLLTPPKHSAAIVDRLPGSEHVVVRDAGHLIMLEHPELVSSQILELIDRATVDLELGIPVAAKPRVRRFITDIGRRRRVRRARRAESVTQARRQASKAARAKVAKPGAARDRGAS
ncbi:lipase [Knoellia sinensis KCTC 19936]|uniref:Lipase n=1 Tax=Knoellia sinensis KCTC 19936 TaxID=1385520 RepID=A0A0A0J7V4_9MICO|nr:alpha/beta hydrolase [Knoellia sinensis]KGN32849.1 lipase [Knoellia sinensis KCTC 19936]